MVVKLQERNGQFFLTIPKAIAEMKDWNGGTLLYIFEYKGDVILKEVKPEEKIKK